MQESAATTGYDPSGWPRRFWNAAGKYLYHGCKTLQTKPAPRGCSRPRNGVTCVRNFSHELLHPARNTALTIPTGERNHPHHPQEATTQKTKNNTPIPQIERTAPGTPPTQDSTPENRTRQYTNHAGGYYVCSHTGCSKKIDQSITDHDCCGRCTHGRACHQHAMNNYNGPGAFHHQYWGSPLSPGKCTTCGETKDAH